MTDNISELVKRLRAKLDSLVPGVHDHIDEVFKEILGEAGEKVTDTGGAFGGLMDGLAKACSPAAPAPETCKWAERPAKIGAIGGFRGYRSGCGHDTTLFPVPYAAHRYCVFCGKRWQLHKEKS